MSCIRDLDIRVILFSGRKGSLALAKSISRTRGGGYRITFRNIDEFNAACGETNYLKWIKIFSANIWKSGKLLKPA
jgi:hypothetical protein